MRCWRRGMPWRCEMRWRPYIRVPATSHDCAWRSSMVCRTAGPTRPTPTKCAARLRNGSTRLIEEFEMPIVQHNPPELFPRYRCYTHATEIRGDSRLLIISGLNGYLQD